MLLWGSPSRFGLLEASLPSRAGWLTGHRRARPKASVAGAVVPLPPAVQAATSVRTLATEAANRTVALCRGPCIPPLAAGCKAPQIAILVGL